MSDQNNGSEPSRVRTNRIVPSWLVALGATLIVLFTGVLLSRVWFPQWWVNTPLAANEVTGEGGVVEEASEAADDIITAEVIELTAVTAVEGTGSLQPLQQAAVPWGTTGQVFGVHVAVGDRVFKDQVLMTLDPESVPVTILQAQFALINAENTLEDLLNPTALQIAQAEQRVVIAEQALEDAEEALENALNPNIDYAYETVADAELALFQAEADAQLATVSADVQRLSVAQAEAAQAYARVQDAQAFYDAGNRTAAALDALRAAQGFYEAEQNEVNELLLRIERAEATQANSVDKARDNLEDAIDDLNSVLGGPSAETIQTRQVELNTASAELEDARRALDELINPDEDDVAGLQADITQNRMILEALLVQAPFAGEVLQVNARQGDLTDQTQPAVIVANMSALHLDVQVDENDVVLVAVGQPATVSFTAIDDLVLPAVVSDVGRVGTSINGIVRYRVEVTLLELDPRVKLGMTADAVIVTEVAEGTLAAPLDAIQVDFEGEYVVRVNDDGTSDRIAVVTGDIQEDYVLLEERGDLRVGDSVQLFNVQPTSQGIPFGPPGD